MSVTRAMLLPRQCLHLLLLQHEVQHRKPPTLRGFPVSLRLYPRLVHALAMLHLQGMLGIRQMRGGTVMDKQREGDK